MESKTISEVDIASVRALAEQVPGARTKQLFLTLCSEIERLRALNGPDERGQIVAWMRSTADVYAQSADLVGAGYARNWRIIADLIESEADKSPLT